MEFGMDIIVTYSTGPLSDLRCIVGQREHTGRETIYLTYGNFPIIFILVTTDVVGDNWCGRSSLWPFRCVAVPVCGRSCLWPYLFVAASVCGGSGFWPFRFVALLVCGRCGLWPFRLWPFRFVAVMTCYRWSSGYNNKSFLTSFLMAYYCS